MQHTLQIAMLNGRSNPANWALSPAQQAFLRQLGGADRHLTGMNFPYLPVEKAYQPTALLRASLANSKEYLNARIPWFRRRYRPVVQALLQQAEHTVFVAGSCGLELLNCLQLAPSDLEKISVFAYGPVARARPACHSLLVQGRADWISRRWFADADIVVDADHLNYLQQDEVLQHCRQFIDRIAAGLHKEPRYASYNAA
ncbi:hypothetical protein [Undibacterium squillarum]|uniref:hypothetical protein n=1 Tax=Undibacterium squillarum TaxID=1131567 RepID=UPI0035AFBF4A